MRAIVLTGLRLGQPERDRNWEFNRSRWERRWPVVPGYHDGPGPFCMSVASNRAAAEADLRYPGWDVAIYVGGDFAIGSMLAASFAADEALTTGKFVVAHDETVMLSQGVTAALVAGDVVLDPSLGERYPNAFTGVVAFPRELFEVVRGFDERFVGWGWEDQAFWSSCWAAAGGFGRIENSVVYHLWHPSSRESKEDSPTYWSNETLGRRYLDARTSWDATLAIIEERP